MSRFGFSSSAEPRPTQLVLDFSAPTDWQRGPIEKHWLDPLWSCSCHLDGELAGSFHRRDDGPWRAWVHKGYRIYSRTGMSTHVQFVGEFASPEDAEAALQAAARAARADTRLIWEGRCTKENIRKAKANGWWRAVATTPADL